MEDGIKGEILTNAPQVPDDILSLQSEPSVERLVSAQMPEPPVVEEPEVRLEPELELFIGRCGARRRLTQASS